MMRARKYTAEVMRFVRGAQAMTHDERVWFDQNIEPIIERAIASERKACAEIAELRAENAKLREERDAAFAMSKCECETNEACANLVKLHDENAKLLVKNDELLGMREEVLHYQREFHRLRDEIAKLREQRERLIDALKYHQEQTRPIQKTRAILAEIEGEKHGL